MRFDIAQCAGFCDAADANRFEVLPVIRSDQPADGGRGTTVPLSSKPYSRSSYFGYFLFRHPLPAEIGGGISGGSIGNPESPAGSGDTAEASCTGV